MGTIVVGAGPVGLAVAWALRRRGEDVTVLGDRVAAPSAASASTGWLTPSLSTPLASPGIIGEGLRHALDRDGALVIRPRLDLTWARWLLAFRRAATPARYRAGVAALMDLNRGGLDLLDTLAAELRASGGVLDVHDGGVLALARTRGGLSWFDGLFAELAPLGFPGRIERMTGAEARSVEPAISPSVVEAARCTIDRNVDPDQLLAELIDHLQSQGVTVLDNAPLTSLVRDGRGWRVDAGRTTFAGSNWAVHHADHVVIAAGVASPRLLAPLGVRLPVIAGTGYGADVAGVDPLPATALYLAEVKIGTSTWGERLRVSGTFELFGRRPGWARIERQCKTLLRSATPYLDGLTADYAWTWGQAGQRPCTPDGLPIIGAVPGQPGLWIATGHNMLGVTLALSTGERLATQMLERPGDGDDLRAFAAGRTA